MMNFGSKKELGLHDKNICSIKGCGKKFASHKYRIHNQKVHREDCPLQCPWEGCTKTFKRANMEERFEGGPCTRLRPINTLYNKQNSISVEHQNYQIPKSNIRSTKYQSTPICPPILYFTNINFFNILNFTPISPFLIITLLYFIKSPSFSSTILRFSVFLYLIFASSLTPFKSRSLPSFLISLPPSSSSTALRFSVFLSLISVSSLIPSKS